MPDCVIVQLLSHVQLFATPPTLLHQVSLSITTSWNLFRLMSIESVMPSSHLILCHLLLFHLSQHQGLFQCIGSFHLMMTGASASPLVLPMNIQGWFPLGLTCFISSQSKRFSGVFSSIPIQKHQFLGHSAFLMVQLPHPNMTTGKNQSFEYMDLCRQSDVSAF